MPDRTCKRTKNHRPHGTCGGVRKESKPAVSAEASRWTIGQYRLDPEPTCPAGSWIVFSPDFRVYGVYDREGKLVTQGKVVKDGD